MIQKQHTEKYEDLVYDVGMHKGEDTDYYLKKGFRVISFEANPDLAEQCRQRFKNEIEGGKLVIIEGAIVESAAEDDKNKKISFYRNKDRTVWGTVVDAWAQRNEGLGTSNEIIEVPVVNFSSCVEKYGIPHYLKIDIEGMDTLCLKALLPFCQKPDYISIESEKVSFDKLITEIDLLQQLGYTRFKAVQQSGIARQKEPNPAREGVYVGHQFPPGCSGLFGGDLAGKWKNDRQIIDEYRRIFFQYRWFGDYSKIRKTSIGQFLIKKVQKRLGRLFPGWYDTHAKHASVAFQSKS